MPDRLIAGALANSTRARNEARPDTQQNPTEAPMRRGIVTAVSSGVYTVDVVGSSGAAVRSYSGLRSWGGSFEVGDQVWIVWEGNRPVPFLMGGGGSGSGTSDDILAVRLIPGFDD